MKTAILLSLFVCLTRPFSTNSENVPSCPSKIYCQGDLLKTIQMAKLYNDSKTFVDLKMKTDETETLNNFYLLMRETNRSPTKEQLQKFVDDNFEPGNELEDWKAPDFDPNPSFLDHITNSEFKKFAAIVHNIWPDLAREVKPEVIKNQEKYSLIPVDNGFIIPGGRFKEIYYWDTYWIIQGLLVSNMTQTTKGILENFISIIERYGFVPNGGRVYYLNRSHPPLLTLMVEAYVKITNDTKFVQKHIKTLDTELTFFLTNKTVEFLKDGVPHTLAHYNVESNSPRPESYWEDVQTCSNLKEEAKDNCYSDLKSGAESGWDFSSRWLFDADGNRESNLSDIQTRRVIPVDLNAFLTKSFLVLSQFYEKIGDRKNSIIWLERFFDWQNSIDEVLYNKEDGIWYDFDVLLSKQRPYFYPSNFAPLWAQVHDTPTSKYYGERAADYLINKDIVKFEGGTPTSTVNTGLQWDYPNAWPPLQTFVIFGLEKSGDATAKGLARKLAKRWITANMIGYNNTQAMFEKYNADVPGQYGGGGEYEVQKGFGWTNGAALKMIEYFYSDKSIWKY